MNDSSINNIYTNNKTNKTRKQKLFEKQLYGYFKRQTYEIHTRRSELKKENLKSKTESLLIAV